MLGLQRRGREDVTGDTWISRHLVSTSTCGESCAETTARACTKSGALPGSTPALASFVVATGAEPAMRALERRMLRCLAPSANTTFVSRGPWRAAPADEGPVAGRRRARPPPRLRPRAHPATIAAWTFIFGGLEAAVRRHAEWTESRAHARAARKVREMTYGDAYDVVAQSLGPGTHAPLHVFDPQFFNLLVSWVCTRASRIDWLDLAHRGGRALLYRIAFAINGLQRPGRRLAGIR